MKSAWQFLRAQPAAWLASAGIAAMLWSAFCTIPAVYWNPPRLAPAFALAEGLNLYALRGSGAHLGWFYGPVFPLWSLPAAGVANITAAVLVWGLLNLVAIVVPAALVLRELVPARPGARLLGLLLFGVLLMGNWLTLEMLFSIHIDALCTGLGLVGCLLLVRAAEGGRGRGAALHGAALAVALAVWTKQIAICLVPAMLAWCWWQRRRDLLLGLLLWLPAYAAGLGLVFAWRFGMEELVFNIWLVQAQTPFRGGWADFGRVLVRLGVYTWPWLAVPAVLAWLGRPRSDDDRSRRLAQLLWLVAACFVPLGLTAAMKVGGWLNSLHSLNYLLPLMAAALARAAAAQPVRARAGLAVLVGLAVAVGFYRSQEREGQWVLSRKQEQWLAVARENPGRVYFPWNPLPTLITDRRIYPFDNALFCLWAARFEIPAELVRAAAPAKPIIIYDEPAQSKMALEAFKASP